MELIKCNHSKYLFCKDCIHKKPHTKEELQKESKSMQLCTYKSVCFEAWETVKCKEI